MNKTLIIPIAIILLIATATATHDLNATIISPAEITLNSPLNNSINHDFTVNLNATILHRNNVTTQVTFYGDNNPLETMNITNTSTPTNIVVPWAYLDPLTTYEWRVEAYDELSNQTTISPTWTFTTRDLTGAGGGGQIPTPPEEEITVEIQPSEMNVTIATGDTKHKQLTYIVTTHEEIHLETKYSAGHPLEQKLIQVQPPNLITLNQSENKSIQITIKAPVAHPEITYTGHLRVLLNNTEIASIPLNIQVVEQYKLTMPKEITATHRGNKIQIPIEATLNQQGRNRQVTFKPTGDLQQIMTTLEITEQFYQGQTKTITTEYLPEEGRAYTGYIEATIEDQPEVYRTKITIKPHTPWLQSTVTTARTLVEKIQPIWILLALGIIATMYLIQYYHEEKEHKENQREQLLAKLIGKETKENT